MKKGIAFLLAAVMCLGFVGCELPGMGLARKIVGKTVVVNAEMVFKELEKEGELILDTKYDSTESFNSAKVPNVEMIVFRMPKEERPTYREKACYIEVYPSQEDLERSCEQYVQTDSKYNWLYSSGNVLLRIDGNVPKGDTQKYTSALKELTKDNVQKWNDRNPEVEKSNRKKTFQPPNGFGANEAFERLKEELGGLEFAIYSYLHELEFIIFWDRTDSKLVCGTISIAESDEDALSLARVSFDGYQGSKFERSILVSGNIIIELDRSSEELFFKYSNALERVTGKPINMEYSKRTES